MLRTLALFAAAAAPLSAADADLILHKDVQPLLTMVNGGIVCRGGTL